MYQVQRTITYTCIEVNKDNYSMLETIGVLQRKTIKAMSGIQDGSDTSFIFSQDKTITIELQDIISNNKTNFLILDPITKKWSKYDEVSFKATSPEMGSFSKV